MKNLLPLPTGSSTTSILETEPSSPSSTPVLSSLSAA
nr:MAG TPA: hypothetical protein [Bacteriophage sp.]